MQAHHYIFKAILLPLLSVPPKRAFLPPLGTSLFSGAEMLKKAGLKKEITTLETAIFTKTVFKHLLSQNHATEEQDTVHTLIPVSTLP